MPTTSTAGSPQPLGEPVRRASIFVRERDGFDDAIERVRGRRARGRRRDHRGRSRPRRRARRRRDDAARVPRVPRPRARDRRQLRPLRLSRVDAARRHWRTGLRRVVRRRLRRASSCRRSSSSTPARRARRGQRRRRRERRRSDGSSSSNGRSAASRSARCPATAIIAATPSGSTAYNLSNNGPVLMWGIDAMAVSFVAPHSLHARPLVVPRGRDVVDHEPHAGHPARADRRRAARRRRRAGRRGHRAARRREDPAGDASGRDVPDPFPVGVRLGDNCGGAATAANRESRPHP